MTHNQRATEPQTRRPKPWALTITTAIMVAFLTSLGVWQLQRLAWKEGLIAKLETSQNAAPVPLEEVLASHNKGDDIQYRRVRVRGTFIHDAERYFYAPNTKLGPGFDIYTPLQLSGDRGLIMVNRGYVPEPLKAQSKRAAGLVTGEHEITGIVRLPGKKRLFTPENNPAKNLWFWRDFDAMTAHFNDVGKTGRKLGLFVDAEMAAPGGWPRGGRQKIELSNRHFGYAITWFGLALTLLGVYGAMMLSRFKK